ncbi:telomerase inhibitor [Coniosporium apollinis]|uniref:PinX1-related protein 1 n=1 Tax=Coniosporium apollinis TaxID=61459 RepID=A0ABQ9P2L1_9PEZI|nr:telomerase inhibitor [Coniosporium apollinis]
MGLAGPKNRSKISTDPNNTTWSRSTSRFGHRILTSQGWTPGQALNPHAGHAGHYTAANTSHIRIALKDDNLGLGATRGGRDAETFGLSQLAGLLGRLNGKGEGELKREEAARRDVQLVGYQQRRWGAVRFVSGGFLVGEKVEDGDVAAMVGAGEPDAASLKKRKRTDEEEPEEEETRSLKKRSGKDLRAEAKQQESRDKAPKESRKRKCQDVEDVGTTTEPATAASSSNLSSSDEKAQRRKRRAEKKARKAAESGQSGESGESATATTTADVSAAVSSDEIPDKAEKRRRKAEKKAAKELKRLEKEAKRAKREERRLKKKERTRTDDTTSSASSKESSPELSASLQQAEAQAKPPARFAGGRHAVRRRYIRSKQMASMDPQALKEIFMIKAQS